MSKIYLNVVHKETSRFNNTNTDGNVIISLRNTGLIKNFKYLSPPSEIFYVQLKLRSVIDTVH